MKIEPVRQAVVLCAGRGTRLGTLAKTLPKSMLPIGGRPLICHIVEKLQSAGFDDLVLVVGHLGQQIELLFAGCKAVRCAWQRSPDGTAHALLAASDLLKDRFMVTYGDLWMSADDYRGIRLQGEAGGVNQLAVNHSDCPRGAAVYLEDRRVIRVVEKPQWGGECDTNWNAAGTFIMTKRIVHECAAVERSSRGEYELAGAIQGAIDKGAVFWSYQIIKPQIDIGCPERYHSICLPINGSGRTMSPISVSHQNE